MNLSIVIPMYNSLPDVLTCLNSLQAFHTPEHRVHPSLQYFIQDDCSPDVDARAVISPLVASVDRNPVNLGFGGNVHRAIARTSTEVVVIVNQDVYAVQGWSENWDSALLAAFDDPQVAVAAPRLLFPNGSVQSAAGEFDQLCQPVHRCLGWGNVHHPEIAAPREVEWATGAMLALRREVWDGLGGFDTDYRMYWSDVDYCLRVREHGFKVVYQPTCTVIHKVGGTGGSPHFLQDALLFKRLWVDSGKVSAGQLMPTVRYW